MTSKIRSADWDKFRNFSASSRFSMSARPITSAVELAFLASKFFAKSSAYKFKQYLMSSNLRFSFKSSIFSQGLDHTLMLRELYVIWHFNTFRDLKFAYEQET